jgi:hypothetical protein
LRCTTVFTSWHLILRCDVGCDGRHNSHFLTATETGAKMPLRRPGVIVPVSARQLLAPQSHLERCLKRFGGGGRNDAPGGSWEHVSDQLDRLAHHIGKACSKTRVFKRPNRSFERCEVFWCHAINASKCWR